MKYCIQITLCEVYTTLLVWSCRSSEYYLLGDACIIKITQALSATLLVKFENGIKSKISNDACIHTKEESFVGPNLIGNEILG